MHSSHLRIITHVFFKYVYIRLTVNIKWRMKTSVTNNQRNGPLHKKTSERNS